MTVLVRAGPLHGALPRAVEVRPGEVRALLMSFAYFFFVMSAWFVLRPIRDSVAAASGVSKLPLLFAGTLTAMLVCNPLFSALVVRFSVRRFIAITYHFFIANLLVFYTLLRVAGPAEGSALDAWVGRAFFVWTSVFNLFVVSIFWSFMADVFASEQAKRMFGFIGVGGTLGSIAGSGFTAAMASRMGTVNLLLVSAVLLEVAVLVVMRFPHGMRAAGDARAALEAERVPIGGSVWAGFTHLVRSRYLLGTGVFLMLYTLGSTVLYAEQSDMVGRFYADRAARTTVFAQLELAAQTLTVVTQIFLTGRIIRWFGLATALAIVPVVSMLGFGALGTVPVFATLAVFTVCRRAMNFSLMNPSMEVLFTVVKREDKYKAKSFIETFVYRAGDQIAVWTYAGMTALGLGLAAISFAAVPVAAVSLMLGVWLGRRQAILAGDRPTSGPVPNAPLAAAT